MKPTWTVRREDSRVVLEVGVPLTSELTRELLSVARTEVRNGAATGILLDLRTVHNDTRPFECYEIANSILYRLEFPRRCHVAMLVGPEGDSFGFLETVIRNAGYPWAIFRELDLALAYLVES